MSAEERLRNSLAERLYSAHQDWRTALSESASMQMHWWALADELKAPYLAAAEALIESESVAESFGRRKEAELPICVSPEIQRNVGLRQAVEDEKP